MKGGEEKRIFNQSDSERRDGRNLFAAWIVTIPDLFNIQVWLKWLNLWLSLWKVPNPKHRREIRKLQTLQLWLERLILKKPCCHTATLAGSLAQFLHRGAWEEDAQTRTIELDWAYYRNPDCSGGRWLQQLLCWIFPPTSCTYWLLLLDYFGRYYISTW